MSASRLRRCLFCLGLGSAVSSQAAQLVVLYGDSDYAPYSYVENGRFTGIYVEMLTRAASTMAPQFEV
jgi:polar amino acid transport system substrate-binding protein